jgi:hypothetical protein
VFISVLKVVVCGHPGRRRRHPEANPVECGWPGGAGRPGFGGHAVADTVAATLLPRQKAAQR